MGKGLVVASLTSLSEVLCRDLTMCLCVWSLGRLAAAGPGCALPWVVGRGRQDQDPSDTTMFLHRPEKPPGLNTHRPECIGGGRPHLALIQPRGWLAAATKAEQGLFIDSGKETPPPAGSQCPPRRTLALPGPVTSQSSRDGPWRAHTR